MFRSQLFTVLFAASLLVSGCGGGGNASDDSAPADPCLDPQSVTCPTADSDNDGILNSNDSAPSNPCSPSTFNAACNQDSDADGKTNFMETETADSDNDGTPDYLESITDDADNDGINNESDPANNDPCIPDPTSIACGTTGLTQRPANTTCIAPDIDINANASIELQQRFAGVNLTLPLQGALAPNDNSYWYIAEKTGNIVRFENIESVVSSEIYIETQALTNQFDDELGLLGFAFSPDWPLKKELYVSYTLNTPNTVSRLSRFVITDDSSLPATHTEQVLFELDQPFDNHNGGNIAFHPTDGYLYWGLGDGGSGFDPADHGQNTTTLLGSMVRIDVNGVGFTSNLAPSNYQIPAGNPFSSNAKCGSADSGTQSCPEIYAWGLRNPWRWSFDQNTGRLYLGDVGQRETEEINEIIEGGNYGWRCYEGSERTVSEGSLLNSVYADCANDTFIDPLHTYPQGGEDQSVTGGFVYRGANIPSLAGDYLFADYNSGRIWALDLNDNSVSSLINSPHFISTFLQDQNNELYILSYGSGGIYQLVDSNNAGGSNSMPESIFDVGCIDTNSTTANPQMIPYSPKAPFWSDAAEKLRWITIPSSSDITAADDFENWGFPPGTVTMKNFSLDNQLIETRFFMRHINGDWAGYSYEWNNDETQASLVIGGKDRVVNLSGGGTQTWRYPSSGECNQCHTSAAGFVLGISTPQLNGPLNYPSTGITANQLDTLNHIDFFTTDVSEPVTALPSLPDPFDASETLSNRARSYLHTNCSSCHRPGGGTPANIDLRFSTALNSTMACNVTPQLGNLGITAAQIINAGSASNSVLHARMTRRDGDAMPPIGSNVVDSAGALLIADWINSLGSCN